MKKRKTINIIGIILIIAVFFFAGVLFPNKARIGYYRQIDDKGKFAFVKLRPLCFRPNLAEKIVIQQGK